MKRASLQSSRSTKRGNGHDRTGNAVLRISARNAALAQQPPKTDWHIPPELITLIKRMRFNPIRGLTPDLLSQHLDWWYIGFLRYIALDWEYMERRHPVIMADAPKRKKAVSRHGWEILTSKAKTADKAEAERHKEVLEFFYGHLSATHAVDQNERGGVSLLVRQMMDSVGKRFAVHEIVWKPSPQGLTADFRFVPLWFFENTTGQLRWLKDPFNPLVGQDLAPGEWLVTCGDGIMEACCILYIYSQLSWRDMIAFSERFGMPIALGKTDAPVGSEAWESMKAVVSNLMNEFSAVMGMNSTVELLEAKSGSQALPMPWVVERCDQYISALWRGRDMATLTRGGAGGSGGSGKPVGASVQGGEGDILEQDDAIIIEETLNAQIDRFVIEYTFGEGVEPLAYFHLHRPDQKNVQAEILTDQFLLGAGAPLGVDATLERYGREKPDAGEELLKAPAAPPKIAGDPSAPPVLSDASNIAATNAAGVDKFIEAMTEFIAEAQHANLKVIADEVQRILALPDDQVIPALQQLYGRRVELLKQMNASPKAAAAFEKAMSEALVLGLTKKGPTA